MAKIKTFRVTGDPTRQDTVEVYLKVSHDDDSVMLNLALDGDGVYYLPAGVADSDAERAQRDNEFIRWFPLNGHPIFHIRGAEEDWLEQEKGRASSDYSAERRKTHHHHR